MPVEILIQVLVALITTSTLLLFTVMEVVLNIKKQWVMESQKSDNAKQLLVEQQMPHLQFIMGKDCLAL